MPTIIIIPIPSIGTVSLKLDTPAILFGNILVYFNQVFILRVIISPTRNMSHLPHPDNICLDVIRRKSIIIR